MAISNDGSIWIFGGYGYIGGTLGIFVYHTAFSPITVVGKMNDLFRYNISSRKWTWMSGLASQGSAGSYGTLHVENTSNMPAGRYDHVMEYSPQTNNLIIYGGNAFGN